MTENLEFFASAYGLRGERRRERIGWAMGQFELGAHAGTTSAQLPGGFKQRLAMAAALLHEPEILFLDEPSGGLDPISARRFDTLIRQLRDGFGVTVVMVSHELPSLFAICDDGIFLDAESHTAIAHGAPAALRDTCSAPIVHAFMNGEGDGTRPASPVGVAHATG